MSTPASELENRVTSIQSEMQKHEIDGALLFHVPNSFYFIGRGFEGFTWVPVEGAPRAFVRRGLEYHVASGAKHLEPAVGFSKLSKVIGKHKRIGTELDVVPYNHFKRIAGSHVAQEIVDIHPAVLDLRAIKSEYELDLMRKSGHLLAESMEYAAQTMEAGMTEAALAARIDTYLCERGHPNYIAVRSFSTRVTSNALVVSGSALETLTSFFTVYTGQGHNDHVPIGPSMKKLKPGEPILIDTGSHLNGYITDCARTFAIGELDARLRDDMDAVNQILKSVEKQMRPGNSAKEIFKHAFQLADELGVADRLMGLGDDKVKFLGHGVGLELDEMPLISPWSATELRQRHVFAVEPKIIAPGIGATGTENTYAVRKDGLPENLTPADHFA